jgi:hypothetical protein
VPPLPENPALRPRVPTRPAPGAPNAADAPHAPGAPHVEHAATGREREHLDELRDLVLLHARAQGLDPARAKQVLERVRRPWGDGPGSWGRVWTEAGDALAEAGRHADACRHYALGRFPYPDGNDRALAAARCAESFERGAPAGAERLDVTLPEGTVRCWTAGLGAPGRPGPRRPLLLVIGGIVSVKEQWAPILARAGALGFAVLVTELPGVGENTLPYRADSARMISAVLDAVGERADVARTFAIALSFGGHLALRCALADRRLRGIATVGAPVAAFFQDAVWQRQVPVTTVRTLAHLTGTDPSVVFGFTRGWALGEAELRSLDVPVSYVASLRDEIVPLGDAALLRRCVPAAEVVVNDDVHGSPEHLAATRAQLLRAVLRASGAGAVRRAAFGTLTGLSRLRGAA